MDINQLPPSYVVGTSATIEVLAAAINTIIGDTPIVHFGIIRGDERSGRFFTSTPIDGETVELYGGPAYGHNIAEMLMALVPQARYPAQDSSTQKKGWEIRDLPRGGTDMVIAFAAWV